MHNRMVHFWAGVSCLRILTGALVLVEQYGIVAHDSLSSGIRRPADHMTTGE